MEISKIQNICMKRERKFNNEFYYTRKAKLIMTKNYSYIPNKENLFILLKSEYENIIRQLKQNKEVHSFNTVNKSIIPQKVINTFELLMLKTVRF